VQWTYCWTYWLFCTFRTPNNFFAYFTVKTKTYNIIISHTFSNNCSLKILFLFLWILLLNSTTSLQSLGHFYKPPGIITKTVLLSVLILWGLHSENHIGNSMSCFDLMCILSSITKNVSQKITFKSKNSGFCIVISYFLHNY